MEKKEKKKRAKAGAYGFANRILSLYDRLNEGRILYVEDIKKEFNIEDKTIGRDIGNLETHYSGLYGADEELNVIRDRDNGCFYLNRNSQSCFTMEEALTILQIVLAGRAFCEEEKEQIVSKILMHVSEAERGDVERMIANERVNYTPLKHGKKLLEPIRLLTEYIRKHELIAITYKRMDGEVRIHRIKPVAVMFDIFYFYLHAYMADDSKKDATIFRIDRIVEMRPTGETFRVETGEKRFQEGEIRKQVLYMYAGKSERVKFEYHGKSIEAVQDWLPEAQITPLEGGGYLVRALIHGEGARMWIRSQGDWVKMVEE